MNLDFPTSLVSIIVGREFSSPQLEPIYSFSNLDNCSIDQPRIIFKSFPNHSKESLFVFEYGKNMFLNKIQMGRN